MTDVSVVILVGREELHIARCLEKLAALSPRQIFVVESLQDGATHALAEKGGATTVFHTWPGNQAAQFQWALDNLPIEANWILRLDADEYLTPELIAEIQERLPKLPDAVAGIVLRRRHIWREVWVKRGMYPTRILRLFRRGRGKSDGKLMDEHILVDGASVEFQHDFVDHSLIPLEDWEAKHRNYARREAQSFLAGEKSTGVKGRLKWCYYHLLPSFARPAIYWFRRAIIGGAYFESAAARDFTWRHAFWYRTLVEREIKSLKLKGWEKVGN